MKKILIILLIFAIIIGIFFFIFGNKKSDFSKNIVFVEKKAKIVENVFALENPSQILSKGIFIKNNLVLTVSHGVSDFSDSYNIYLENNDFFGEAKLVYKDENLDFAILETFKNFDDIYELNFGKITEKLYFFDKNGKFEAYVDKIEENKIYIKNSFISGDSGTIFFNENNEIVGILTEINLEKNFSVVNILDKKSFKF